MRCHPLLHRARGERADIAARLRPATFPGMALGAERRRVAATLPYGRALFTLDLETFVASKPPL